mmetsp:Transcript_49488/g.67330  ORF Transcript_49488/g.67330 Transcript_49488/m.67330 type:complete len:229 (+) Transcript_49488:64-750(+)
MHPITWLRVSSSVAVSSQPGRTALQAQAALLIQVRFCADRSPHVGMMSTFRTELSMRRRLGSYLHHGAFAALATLVAAWPLADPVHAHLQRSRLRLTLGKRHLAREAGGCEVLVLQRGLAQQVVRAHRVVVVDGELDHVAQAAARQLALEVPDGTKTPLDDLGLELRLRPPRDGADAVGVRRPVQDTQVRRAQALGTGDLHLEREPLLQPHLLRLLLRQRGMVTVVVV